MMVHETGYDPRDLFPLVFGMLGVAVIIAMEVWNAQGNSLWGVALGLVNGLLYAGSIMLFRSVRSENPVWVVSVTHLAAAMFMFPYILYLGIWPTSSQLLILAAFGVIQMGVPYLLFVQGLRRISSQEASLIGLLEPVLLPLWVLAVLRNDEARWWTLVGGSLILTGLVGRYLTPPKSPSPAPGGESEPGVPSTGSE